jgi:hypothetical protein
MIDSADLSYTVDQACAVLGLKESDRFRSSAKARLAALVQDGIVPDEALTVVRWAKHQYDTGVNRWH